ncbi:hypothetical protein [Chitinolyticbacter albus]|uniref:hypothetical protein n=1 Tax=Chitinolyticbacter albus TaxID=2961951 RepID=UPI002108DBF9|nr:hypothetical protein [Chitinolyticbacter albus]
MMLPIELSDFLTAYRAAFDALDGEAVADFYHLPSGIVSAEGYTHWPDRAAIARNMFALCALYREHGYAGATYDVVAYLPQGEQGAVLDVAWKISRHGGSAPWCFHTTYNLLHTQTGWRVLLCTAYEEQRLDR